MLFNFYLFSLATSLVITLALFIYAWQNARYPGAKAYGMVMLIEAIWVITSLGAIFDNDLHSRVLWLQIRLSAISFLSLVWLVVVIQYTGNGEWLKKRWIPAFALYPVFWLVFIWSMPYHQLYRYNFHLEFNGAFYALHWDVGPISRIHALFDYAIAYLASYVLLILHLRRDHARYFQRNLLLILSASIVAAPELVYFINPTLTGGVNLTANFFGLSGLMAVGAIFRGRMFSLLPIAHSTLFANMRDGVLVLDLNQVLVDLNQSARAMLQIQQDVTGLPAAKLLPDWPALLAAAGGETRISDSEGRAHFFEVRLTTLYDENRQRIGQMVNLRDITNRKRAEENTRLQVSALEAAANAISIFDAKGYFIWVNPAFTRLTGYTPEELKGQRMRMLVADEVNVERRAAMWQTVQSGQVWHGQMINRRKDGSLYPEEQTVTPLLDANGQLTHLIAVKQDISERIALENMRQDLTQMLVHDMRSPLNQITLGASILAEATEGANSPVMRAIQDGAERLGKMLNDILDLNRLESNQMPLSLEPLNIEELFDEILEATQPLADQKRITLKKSVSDGLPIVRADAVLLQRVLQNLVGNALKFTPTGGEIELVCQHNAGEEHLQISVRDSGPGIAQAILPRLFQKYATIPQQGRGLGLGLAFCRLVVEAHCSKIEARNLPGGGAVFFFDLPLANQLDEDAP